MTTCETLQNDTQHHNIQMNNTQYNDTKCNNDITIVKKSSNKIYFLINNIMIGLNFGESFVNSS